MSIVPSSIQQANRCKSSILILSYRSAAGPQCLGHAILCKRRHWPSVFVCANRSQACSLPHTSRTEACLSAGEQDDSGQWRSTPASAEGQGQLPTADTPSALPKLVWSSRKQPLTARHARLQAKQDDSGKWRSTLGSAEGQGPPPTADALKAHDLAKPVPSKQASHPHTSLKEACSSAG